MGMHSEVDDDTVPFQSDEADLGPHGPGDECF
jgi:hypothetical protein